MNRFSPSPTDTIENPVKHGNMITCWQQGRRVLMHSSEVAKLMRKQSSSPSLPDFSSSSWPDSIRPSMTPSDKSQRSMDYRASHRQAALTRGPMQPGNDEESRADDKKKTASYNLSPPPIRSRNRALAKAEGWQMLAKEMVRASGHPPRCHNARCRRSKKCEGGSNACYLREFEAVDVAMQRHVLSAIKRAAAS
jgi:hypothetical protein